MQLTIWLYLNGISIDQPYRVIQITLTVLISLCILCSYSKFFISGFIFISRSSIKMLNSLICMTVLLTQNGPIQYWFFFWQLLFKIQLACWFLIQTVLLLPGDTFFRNVVCWQVKGSKEFQVWCLHVYFISRGSNLILPHSPYPKAPKNSSQKWQRFIWNLIFHNSLNNWCYFYFCTLLGKVDTGLK